MFKNVASQKVTLLVIDTATNLPKTGDAANLTFYVSKDDGSVTALGDTSATELDSTNALGLYTCDLTQAETNADKLVFSGKSSTSGVRVVPLLVYTVPANFTSLTITGGKVPATIAAGDLANDSITAAAIASDAGTEIGTAVWATTTRLLTAGTNIVLAKGTGITGFNDLSAAQVNAECDTALSDVGLTTTITGRIDAAISTRLATAGYTAPLDAAGVRTAVGLASANLDTQLGDLPTAAENSTAVWGAGTRLLTAGTNIVLAKGTGVTGFNDLDAAGVRSAVGLASANLDTQLGDLPTAAENATAIWGAGTRELTAGTNIVLAKGTGVTGFNDPTAATIADAVWDEAIGDHDDAGSTGEALAAAGSAGDPWTTALPGTYSSGQAGYIIGTAIPDAIAAVPTAAEIWENGTRTLTSGGGGGGNTTVVPVDRPVPLQSVGASEAITFAFVSNSIVDGVETPTNITSIALALYVNNVVTAVVVSSSNPSTGTYSCSFTTPSDIEAGDSLYVKATGTISGTSVASIVWNGIVPAPSSEGPGIGARTVTITVTDGTDPLETARVRVTQGAESFVQSTDVNGEVTFNLNDATWTVAVTKAGYTFAGASLVVNGDKTQTYAMAQLSITPPATPGLSAVEILCLDAAGQPEPGVDVDIRISRIPEGSQNVAFKGTKQTATSDANGIARFEVVQSSTCEWKRGRADTWQTVQIDGDGATNITSVIGSP